MLHSIFYFRKCISKKISTENGLQSTRCKFSLRLCKIQYTADVKIAGFSMLFWCKLHWSGWHTVGFWKGLHSAEKMSVINSATQSRPGADGQGSTKWLSWLFEITENPISHGNFSLKTVYLTEQVYVKEKSYCDRKNFPDRNKLLSQKKSLCHRSKFLWEQNLCQRT